MRAAHHQHARKARAWPATYRVTGVQTFIVSHDGIVYQQDLGPDTAKIASAMAGYDPDKGWTPAENNAKQ